MTATRVGASAAEGAPGVPIFPWSKKNNDPTPGEGKPDAPQGAVPPGDSGFSADKARKWFDSARRFFDQGNNEYSLVSWLSGLRFDPTSVDALQSFFKTAAAFAAAGNRGVSKEVAGAVKGSTDVDKFLMAVLSWSADPNNADLAVKATTSAVALGLAESAMWMAPRALALCAGAERPRKDHLIKLMEIFHSSGNNDMAVKAGEVALSLDPSDNNLRADVRDLAAQASIDKGGYEQAGQAGGFRTNVRDLDKQRKLDEAERIVKTEEVHARVIAEAKGRYLDHPADRPLIKNYIKALLDRGLATDESEAVKVAEKAFADTQEFQFRKLAGEIRMRQGRRTLRELRAAADAPGADPSARATFDEALKSQLELEIAEYRALVEAYPTDVKLKYELGVRCLEAGHNEEAIEQFQQSRGDGQLKQRSLFNLGVAFQNLGWEDEAIETFRGGIAGIADLTNDPMSKDFRYALMASLAKVAQAQRDLAMAEESLKLAQAISMEQITYRDIRQRREQLKALVSQLRAGA